MLSCCTTSSRVPMTDLSNHVDRLLNEAFAGFATERHSAFSPTKPFPALNLWHDAAAFHVEAELPGFSMDDIEINLTGRELTLSATRRTDETDKNGAFVRRERVSGSFARSILLPVAVDAEKVSAKLTNGVLTIVLPKAAEALPRRIAVTHA